MHGLGAEERKHDFMCLGPDRFRRRNDKNARRNNLAHGPQREMFLEKTLLITELIGKLIVRRDHPLAPGQIQLKNRSIRVRQTHEAGHLASSSMLSMVGFTGGCGIGSNVGRGDFMLIASAPLPRMENRTASCQQEA